MATKNHPGEYDCYNKLELDEPYFVLKATDPLAPLVVEDWAMRAEQGGTSAEKVQEARKVASDMRKWRKEKLDEIERTSDVTRVDRSSSRV